MQTQPQSSKCSIFSFKVALPSMYVESAVHILTNCTQFLLTLSLQGLVFPFLLSGVIHTINHELIIEVDNR